MPALKLPTQTFWITRDRWPDGELSTHVEVWTARPRRWQIAGCLGVCWTALDQRPTRVTVVEMRVALGVVPDTDRECVRVGPDVTPSA